MSTLTKDQRKAYEQLIIDSIDSDCYDVECKTDKEKIDFAYNTFMSEVGEWKIPKIGEFKAFQEWLHGLPTVLTIPFYNSDILELAKSIGSLPENATETQENKLLNNYWSFMAMRFLSLKRTIK